MRLLVVLTESPDRDQALCFARQTALATDGSLTLLGVSADLAAKEKLRQTLSADLSPDERKVLEIRSGNFHEQVLDEIEKGEYDLTVIGTDAPADEDSPYLTAAAHLARLSETPLAIVHACPQVLRRALICSREADPDLPTVRGGREFAHRLGIEATILHVMAPSSSAPDISSPAVEAIQIRRGPLIQEIQGEIERNEYDLVIIGPHSVPPAAVGAGPTLARPDFAHQIIQLAPPVVVIIGQPVAAEEQPTRAIRSAELSRIVRTVAVELVIYAVLVTVYAAIAFHYLGTPLAELFQSNLILYAITALVLIVAQGVLLEQLTSFLLDRLRLGRFE